MSSESGHAIVPVDRFGEVVAKLREIRADRRAQAFCARAGVHRAADQRDLVEQALLGERLRHHHQRLGGGVGVEHRRLGHVATHEADALPILQVDGRIEDHRRASGDTLAAAAPSRGASGVISF